jgi:excisionase family DNA binding protein
MRSGVLTAAGSVRLYNPGMKSRHKKVGKRLYLTARDVLADIPPPAIARRLKVRPKVSDAKRVRAEAPASVRPKSAGVRSDEPFLSLEEAAQLLHVSRTGINKLIDAGTLANIRNEGPHRRVERSAVLTYKAESKARQAAGMATMVDATQRLGLYDAEVSERRAALGAFLDDWEAEHSPITSVELERAGKELRKKSQILRKTKTVKTKR